MSHKLIPLMLLVLIISVTLASAQAPNLSIVNNSKTNTSSPFKIFINNSESITFNASADQGGITWNWYRDFVLQNNNQSNFTTSFSTGTYHFVQVNGTNANGTSNTIFWGINVFPAMASPSATIQLLNETPSNDLATGIQDDNLTEIVNAPVEVYVNVIGILFYAIVWFIAFGMIWIKQKSLNILVTVGVVFGAIIVTFLPAPYQLVSQLLIAFGVLAILYVFFKGRG